MKKKYLYQTINSETKYDDLAIEIKNEKITPDFRQTYIVKSHKYDGKLKQGKKPSRREEWICKMSLNETLHILGDVIDYQVPLKVPKHKDKNEGKGKIDLLTLKNNTLYLVEYKRLSNTENPLKAICEIYTYYRMLGGICKKNSVSTKFTDNIINKNKVKIKKCKPIVLLTSEDNGDNIKDLSKSVYNKLRNNKKLIKWAHDQLGVECYSCKVNKDTLKIEKESIKKI